MAVEQCVRRKEGKGDKVTHRTELNLKVKDPIEKDVRLGPEWKLIAVE